MRKAVKEREPDTFRPNEWQRGKHYVISFGVSDFAVLKQIKRNPGRYRWVPVSPLDEMIGETFATPTEAINWALDEGKEVIEYSERWRFKKEVM